MQAAGTLKCHSASDLTVCPTAAAPPAAHAANTHQADAYSLHKSVRAVELLDVFKVVVATESKHRQHFVITHTHTFRLTDAVDKLREWLDRQLTFHMFE